jgi:hypothetical protein
MVPKLLLLALLAAGPDVDALRRELDEVAERIEQLKEHRLDGRPIEDGALVRLLVRSLELAEQIEQARPGSPAPAPAPPAGSDPACELADDLREQAAVLRDEAAMLHADAAKLEAEVDQALREEPDPGATFTSVQAILDPVARLGELSERQAILRERARALEEQAALLDWAAEALERTRPEVRGPPSR